MEDPTILVKVEKEVTKGSLEAGLKKRREAGKDSGEAEK
jgi:hypothetical protein